MFLILIQQHRLSMTSLLTKSLRNRMNLFKSSRLEARGDKIQTYIHGDISKDSEIFRRRCVYLLNYMI